MSDLPRNLPDPLALSGSGEKISSPDVWRQTRRPEILELFQTHVYGRAPIARLPASAVKAEVITTPGMMDGTAVRHEVALTFSGPNGRHTMNLLAFVPANAPHPVPAFLLINNRERGVMEADWRTPSPFWPAERLIERGYAAIAFQVDEIDPDRTDGYTNGIRAVFDTRRGPDSWGAIGAWAWGASRVLDWLEIVAEIDPKRVAVIGHSRGGKAALWCGAQDARFALTISNNSGCTGAALSRGKVGENIERINRAFPYWFCGLDRIFARFTGILTDRSRVE